jgi:endonuclease YncB( thermonuclease family)
MDGTDYMGQPIRIAVPRYLLWMVLLALLACLLAALSVAKNMANGVPKTAVHTEKNAKLPPIGNENLAVKNLDTSKNTVELQRVDPRAPLSQIAAPVPPAPPTPVADLPKKWRQVGNGIASAAGIIEAGTVSITLAGLDTLTVDETCTAPSGEVWPCGMVARTAFRGYLRSRTLNCELPEGLIDTAIAAECLLAGEDPAKWLVQNGWAWANKDGPYGGDGELARQQSKGIYGPPPR